MKKNIILKGIVIVGGLILILSLLFSNDEINNYKILKQEEMRKEKIQLDIGIKNKITKEELDKIIEELHNKNNDYERIFIWFHLSNDINKKPWAVANYLNNEWTTDIVATIEEERKLKQSTINTDEKTKIIGKWYTEDIPLAYIDIIYNRNNTHYVITIQKDESLLTEELVKVSDNTYRYKSNDWSDYFKIEPNGNLGHYNSSNKKFSEGSLVK